MDCRVNVCVCVCTHPAVYVFLYACRSDVEFLEGRARRNSLQNFEVHMGKCVCVHARAHTHTNTHTYTHTPCRPPPEDPPQ